MNISVAMTTYNGEKYIEEQIYSILKQTVLPKEIVIFDDKSTDRTIEIIKEIERNNQTITEIKLYQNQITVGFKKNFYKAIEKTSGDIIFLCDQDDVWVNYKIEDMLSIMNKKGYAAMCSNFLLIDQSGNIITDREAYSINSFVENCEEIYKEIHFNDLIYGNIVQGCTYCFTKEVKMRYLQVRNFQISHDKQIMMIATLVGTVVFYNKPLIQYRIHSSNTIGYKKKSEKKKIRIKIPSFKPHMVVFLNDLSKVQRVPQKTWYQILFYLRIPLLRAEIVRKFKTRN